VEPTQLRLTGIVKRYGGVKALVDVEFTVSSGEIVCLLGENGAGKTTLAKVISGQVTPDEGGVTIGGRTVSLRTPSEAHELGIRAVPQELSLAQEMTVGDNILLGQLPSRRFGFINRKAMKSAAIERLEALSLGHLSTDTLVKNLRSADQAFIQIARAMTPGCRFLIADEPTAAMSGKEADTLLKVLESITAAGVGVIFVSHRLGEVLRVGHRVEVLRDGRNALSRDMGSITRADLVDAMMGANSLTPVSDRVELPHEIGVGLLRIVSISSGILRNVSIEVSAGQILGVYGGTGSGREDLGPALFDAQPRGKGDVYVGERKVGRGIEAAISAGIAYVPAERRSKGLLLERSVKENITLSSLAKVSRRGFISRRVENNTAKFWCDKLAIKCSSTTDTVGSLSGGNQQKVLLARWLELGTPVVVLDEPTRGVDVATKTQIYNIMKDISAEGRALLVISSDAEELAACSDSVAVLVNGSLSEILISPTEEEILRSANALTDAA
jgi:ABC-type sugar transport system ATPase subunit